MKLPSETIRSDPAEFSGKRCDPMNAAEMDALIAGLDLDPIDLPESWIYEFTDALFAAGFEITRRPA